MPTIFQLPSLIVSPGLSIEICHLVLVSGRTQEFGWPISKLNLFGGALTKNPSSGSIPHSFHSIYFDRFHLGAPVVGVEMEKETVGVSSSSGRCVLQIWRLQTMYGAAGVACSG